MDRPTKRRLVDYRITNESTGATIVYSRRSFIKSTAVGLAGIALARIEIPFVLGLASRAGGQTIQAARPLTWLDTKSSLLVDSVTGAPVILRGCAWKGYAEDWKTSFARDVQIRVDLMKSYNAGVVRLSLSSGLWQSKDYRNFVDHIVDLLGERNIYAMIDWHNDRADGKTWSQKDQLRHLSDPSFAVSWWREIAERYKHRPHVALFHLMNEPPAYVAPDGPIAEWDFMQTVGQAIHSINPNIILSIAGNPSARDLDYWLARPVNLPRVVYSISHYYHYELNEADSSRGKPYAYAKEYSRGNFGRAKKLLESVRLAQLWKMQSKGLPVLMIEFGSTRHDANWGIQIKDLYEILKRRGVGWIQWVWDAQATFPLCDPSWRSLTVEGELWRNALPQGL